MQINKYVFLIIKIKLRTMQNFKLLNGDCLEMMKHIPDKSIDLVLTDPPYGTTSVKWDSIIPLNVMWQQLKRIIKSNKAIVLTSAQPFTTTLINSNIPMFKYSWIWEKNRPSGGAQAKNKPLSQHEDIIVFSEGAVIHKGQSKRRMPYYPQDLIRIHKVCKNHKHDYEKAGGIAQRPSHKDEYVQEWTNYPKSVLHFDCVNKPTHPTQKPVPLMEYLINTYTEENETVLDFTFGSGTTGVAALNTKRNFIGIELDEGYFIKASERIESASKIMDFIS